VGSKGVAACTADVKSRVGAAACRHRLNDVRDVFEREEYVAEFRRAQSHGVHSLGPATEGFDAAAFRDRVARSLLGVRRRIKRDLLHFGRHRVFQFKRRSTVVFHDLADRQRLWVVHDVAAIRRIDSCDARV